jgi:DNA-binding NtrC family response regulator
MASVLLNQCKLVVVKGAEHGREHVLSGDLIRIGKVEGNDLVLPEETVSRVHCEILRDHKGHLLRDLHSTNGTFLDGAEIREAYIRAGSVITVGTVQLRFLPFDERIEVAPSEKEELGELVGRSQRMREIFALVERIAPTEAAVLFEGEAGTGKQLMARTLHALSRRRAGPFVVVDCGAPAGSLESELFGHDKGAFAGARAARPGAFERAQGGTLLFAQLGELGLELQQRLGRVLAEREVRRVGGNRALKLDVRVLAATRQDLTREVHKGKFREELFFRLSTVPVRVPPLRERMEDLPLLVRGFLARRGLPAPPDDVLARLGAHDWPGNVAELRAAVEHGLVEGAPAHAEPPPAPPETAPSPPFDPALSYRANKDRWERDFERRYLRWLLERADGNISRAAREADMDRKYLHKLLKKHRIVV